MPGNLVKTWTDVGYWSKVLIGTSLSPFSDLEVKVTLRIFFHSNVGFVEDIKD